MKLESSLNGGSTPKGSRLSVIPMLQKGLTSPQNNENTSIPSTSLNKLPEQIISEDEEADIDMECQSSPDVPEDEENIASRTNNQVL